MTVRKVLCHVFAMAPALAMSSALRGAPFDVPIDSAQSSLTFELCVGGTCDADVSAVTGDFIAELDNVDIPGEIRLYDFDLQLTDTLDFLLDFSIFGSLTASVNNGGMMYAAPGVVQGPVPVTTDSFLFAGVPSLAEGMLQYNATGLPCTLLTQSGIPCSDARNLVDEGAQAGDLAGEVTSADRVVTLSVDIDVTAPLDATNPSLGSLHISGTVNGAVLVPRPLGDVDGDGDVDLQDLSPLTTCLAGPEVLMAPTGCSAYHFDGSDLDGDGDADLADFGVFQGVFGE